MIFFKCFLLVFLLSICLTVSACIAEPTKFRGNSLEIMGVIENIPLRILIRKAKIGPNYPFDRALLWGGDQSFPATEVLVEVKVWLGEKEIPIPLSAYADLGRPYKISLKNLNSGFDLQVDGADAGCSYHATLHFANGKLVSKYIHHGEFPQAYQKITYRER